MSKSKILRYCLSILFATMSLTISAQESQLAAEYYRNGEYEKAATLYKKLHDKANGTNYYFNYYVKSLANYDTDAAESAIKSEIKSHPTDVELYVNYGDLLEQSGKAEEAAKQYRKGIDNLDKDVSKISRLANAFVSSAKYDLAEEVYIKGMKVLGNDQVFAFNLADLYRRKDDMPKMVYYYLSALRDNPKNITNIQNILHRNMQGNDGIEELKKQLYANIQEYPEIIQYTELLEWTFIQEKDYEKAFRQSRSLDRELGENGIRVYRIAGLAEEDDDYTTAIKAYNYIVEDKGNTSSFYVNAKKSVLRCKRKVIMEDFKYTRAELDTLDAEYSSFLNEFGVNTVTAGLVKEYAEYLVVYQNNVGRAIELLEQIKVIQGISAEDLALIKLDLADYYLISDDIWEASLLYSQVDKDHKEEYVGELARFKNAKFSYYTGDFEWAEAQFDILKAATSRLISNDAIDLSVFIMDNLGLDTTAVPLQMYAEAELLAFQNKNTQAFSRLDSILIVFPKHGLKDDVLYTKANIYKRMQDYENAELAYSQIIEEFPEEIRCDNAIFELAELYENQLDNQEKAKELYEKLFIDYSNSTFAIDARKRFRTLRGDEAEQ